MFPSFVRQSYPDFSKDYRVPREIRQGVPADEGDRKAEFALVYEEAGFKMQFCVVSGFG
jgi:hypothetical protein